MGYSAYNRVDEQREAYQELMLAAGHVSEENVQKRDAKVEQNETGCESIG